jgi:hypothetical protein
MDPNDVLDPGAPLIHWNAEFFWKFSLDKIARHAVAPRFGL